MSEHFSPQKCTITSGRGQTLLVGNGLPNVLSDNKMIRVMKSVPILIMHPLALGVPLNKIGGGSCMDGLSWLNLSKHHNSKVDRLLGRKTDRPDKAVAKLDDFETHFRLIH
jgi:hypothetical protein